MTKVSRKKISREGIIIANFWRAATYLENKDEVKNFLKALLTPTEMLMLAKRVDIARMLMSDCDYVFMKREAQVTNATISHVKSSLVNGGYQGYLKPLQRMENDDAKIRRKTHKKLERLNFSKTSLSQEITKAAVGTTVRQYKKWKKFRSAKD